MNQLLSIDGDKIVIEKLLLKETEGNIAHSGNLSVTGVAQFKNSVILEQNLAVAGSIDVDTIRVKNLVKLDEADQLDAFTYSGETAQSLDNKGLVWKEAGGLHQFVFKSEPRRLFSTESIDLHKSARYQLGGEDVIIQGRLGNSIVHSKLRSLGVLESITVAGDVNLSETVFIKNSLGRIGINNEQPNAALSIVDNLVEVIIGSTESKRAFIGTWANHALDIITDNTKRISVHGNTTEFGSAKSKNAVVKIHGSLEVDSIVSDIRVERTSPIEFIATKENSIYGKGLTWRGAGLARQLFLYPDPDRLQSTESFELNTGKEYRIGGKAVLSETQLGDSVTHSRLENLGILKGLEVDGNVRFGSVLSIENNLLTIENGVSVQGPNGQTALTGNMLISAADGFGISVKGSNEFYVDSVGSLKIGDKENTSRTVNLYGKLAINITNPDPSAEFSVGGPVVMNGKKFDSQESAPVTGSWNKGDVVWNTEPQENNYIGWVCVQTGSPGVWKPFGYIGTR
jgi:hypothetical protein